MAEQTILTTDRNLKSIGPGLEESGIADEDMEPGDVVKYSEGPEFPLAGEGHTGTIGVIKNSYPGTDDSIDEDDMIKLRLNGMVIVETPSGETIDEGDKVVCAANGKVKSIKEDKGEDETITSGSTSVTVSHDLGYVPNKHRIIVMFDNPELGSADYYYIDSVTDAEFDVNVDQDPEEDLDFDWFIKADEEGVIGIAKTDAASEEELVMKML